MNSKNLKQHFKTDSKRINTLTDGDIDYSDIPELSDDFFKNAILKSPKHKISVTIRLDDDVLEWFRKMGRGYQTRINSLLRQYMKAHKH